MAALCVTPLISLRLLPVTTVSLISLQVANLGANAGFQTWVAFVEEQNEMRRLLQRVANRGLVLAFEKWVENAEGNAGKRERMRVMLIRMGQASLNAAWNTWTAMVESRARNREVLNHSLQMLPGGLGHAWNGWKEQHQEQKRMRRFGARIANRAVSAAFEAWVETAGETSAKMASMVRRLPTICSWPMVQYRVRSAHASCSPMLPLPTHLPTHPPYFVAAKVHLAAAQRRTLGRVEQVARGGGGHATGAGGRDARAAAGSLARVQLLAGGLSE